MLVFLFKGRVWPLWTSLFTINCSNSFFFKSRTGIPIKVLNVVMSFASRISLVSGKCILYSCMPLWVSHVESMVLAYRIRKSFEIHCSVAAYCCDDLVCFIIILKLQELRFFIWFAYLLSSIYSVLLLVNHALCIFKGWRNSIFIFCSTKMDDCLRSCMSYRLKRHVSILYTLLLDK